MNKVKIQLVMAVLLVVSSCSGFLDEPIQGSQTLDNYYTNASEARKAVMGIYQSLSPEDWWEMDFFYLVGDVCSDDAFKGNSIEGDQRDFGQLANYNFSTSNEWLEVKWRFTYQTISRANLVLKYVPSTPMDEDDRDIYLAEAKFLRAYSYFELVKNFGSVPMPLSQLSPDEAVLQREDLDVLWSQIELDLTEAADVLPLRSEQASSDLGRATRGTALAFLAKAHLFQEEWSDAQEIAEQVMAMNYTLEADFENVWSIHNPNGGESIFEIQHVYDLIYYSGSYIPQVTSSRNDGGWGFGTPSSHLENFMAGDPRLSSTIIRHDDFVSDEYPSYDAAVSQNESGRINKKYFIPASERGANGNGDYTSQSLNHILMRYADLLLIHAEAAYHNGQEGMARTSLNEVRGRVSLVPVNVSGATLLQAIYDERRKELAMEGHRLYDLRRTGELADAIEDFVNYNTNTSTDPYDSGNSAKELFDASRHLVFPIPQTEIDLSEGRITQNDNY
ncbi:MAG: RagB/SusD family nutrient uptake outer membrane protein [Reichenbachiella sp.]